MIDVGDVVTLSVEVRAEPVPPATVGDLANAGTMALTVTAPDGTVTGPTTITPTSTGVYESPYTVEQAGPHPVRWVATGANAGVFTDVLVAAAASRYPLVSLADLKAHLNITSTTNDEELRQVLIEASDLAERETHRIFRRTTFVEVHDGGREAIVLRRGPVQSITSVVESGVTLSGTDYVANLAAGMLLRGSATARRCWASGAQVVTVTYVAGEADPPDTAYRLVKELARHAWQTQRGGGGMVPGDEAVPGGAWAISYRAKQLIDSLTSSVGFA